MIDVPALRSETARMFPDFGPNKCREIERLVFEIAKREKTSAVSVLDGVRSASTFHSVKSVLIRRRYPELSGRGVHVSESLSAVDIDPANAVDVATPPRISPRVVYVERDAEGSPLAARFRNLFPESRFEVIESYKSLSAAKDCGAREFNRRLETFLLVKERYDFFKPCPCSNDVVSCGYHNANLGFGCPFECSYCFLQSYTNSPGIVFPVNLDEFFCAFDSYPQAVRVGSGEMTDSLAFDHLTGFSPAIVEYFRHRPKSTFEFKTKSDNIAGLLSVKAAGNVVVGWSVNPQTIIDREEPFTASLEKRIDAARQCAEAGYRTAFHFDPIFYYPGWEADYASVVSMIFDRVPRESISWISLGTLRMTARQKKMIENRFPVNTILDAELLTAPDGKIRYDAKVRRGIYRAMVGFLRGHLSEKTFVYLCMEPELMWRDVGLKLIKSVCN